VLQFDSEASLEEIVLRHALGEDVSRLKLAPGAHGVMMIPIPRAGIFAGAEGVEQARTVPCVEDVLITAKQGQKLLPLPEGSTYLGFLFARSTTYDGVEHALRTAYSELGFHFAATLPIVK
jgi:hypothetical protein